MSDTSFFGRLGTATKLLLTLALVMLPVGGAMIWVALHNFQDANRNLVASVNDRAAASARSVDELLVRNALALRVAAAAAIKMPGVAACDEARRTLAIAPDIVHDFEIEDATGTVRCMAGDFSDIVQPPRTTAGEVKYWIAEDARSLLVRTGVDGGSATARLTVPELRAALGSDSRRIVSASLDDGRQRLVLVAGDVSTSSDGRSRHRVALAKGQIDALIVIPVPQMTALERALILLPVIMWALAALISWWVVNRLLLRPLRTLQKSVNLYQPGAEDQLVSREQLGPAREIGELRDAFARAVDRIDETERGMAEALEGQRRLVREVHHRVKNNLQVVASLLSIHGRTADSREGKAAFSAIGRRVDALSVVHRNHYAELEENQGIALRALLTELSAGLRASAGEQERGTPIELDVDSASTTQDVAVAVAFFVTEIVEFAMLRGETAAVAISLRRTSPLTGRLTIASPVLLDGETESPERKQFDRIVGGLARQLRSPLDRNLGRYSVDLPLFPERG